MKVFNLNEYKIIDSGQETAGMTARAVDALWG
jgi:hypothetical protein